jgi:hypothetical protein
MAAGLTAGRRDFRDDSLIVQELEKLPGGADVVAEAVLRQAPLFGLAHL